MQSARKKLVTKLDRAVSELVRARDKRCVVCGSTQRLTCGHLFSRVAYSTRWDLLNCHAQCWSCNYKHELDSYPYTKWFLEKYGMDAYDELHLRYATPRKFKDWELEEMLVTFKEG